MTTDLNAEKTKVRLCPTCGGPMHRDPVTKKFTKHPASEPVPEPVEIIPLEPKAAPLPKRKPRWRPW